MKPFEGQLGEAENWDYAQNILFTASLSDGHWQSFSYKDNLINKKASQRPQTPLNKTNAVSNVKDSQLSAEPTAYHAQPLFELPPQGRQPQHRDLKCYCRRLHGMPAELVEETPMNKSNEVSNSLMKTVFATLTSIQRCSVPLTGYPQEAEVPKAASTSEKK